MEERNQLREVMKSLKWLARQARQTIMGPTALLARQAMEADGEELVEANLGVAHCKRAEGLHLTFGLVPPEGQHLRGDRERCNCSGRRDALSGCGHGCDIYEGLDEGRLRTAK